MKARILLPAALALLAVLSCKIPGSSSPSASTASSATVFLTDYSGDFSYSLDVGSDPKNVYFVFSNKQVSTSADAATVKNSVGSIKVNGSTIAASTTQPAGGPSASSTKAKDHLALKNRNILSVVGGSGFTAAKSIAVGSTSSDAVSTSGSFYDTTVSDYSTFTATCQYTSGPITVSDGTTRTLNVYVANNCWNGTQSGEGAYGSKKHGINRDMVNALAAKFLTDGVNDIYGWETAMLGPEWGSTGYSELIGFDKQIDILLTDISGDNNDDGSGADGVIVGYFDPSNNFTNTALTSMGYAADSNQKIMFVIDAVLYANPNADGGTSSGGTGWSASNYWAEEVFSTLSHEFQHMIQFYRKGIVVRGDGETADTWINEMCSQLVEDLVASKLGVKGPRGVDPSDGTAGPTDNKYGRIPYFNQYLSSIDRQLTKTSDYDVLDYSFSYAFGAWLMRNYGGAQFVKNVVYSSATDSDCITNAVNSYSGQSLSMGDLISRWAVAVLGSSRTDMPLGYRYNTGDWTNSSSNGVPYKLGSIDFFNYSWTPQVLSGSATTNSIAASSNVYYLAKTGMTGSKNWSLSLPKGVGFNVYVTQ